MTDLNDSLDDKAAKLGRHRAILLKAIREIDGQIASICRRDISALEEARRIISRAQAETEL